MTGWRSGIWVISAILAIAAFSAAGDARAGQPGAPASSSAEQAQPERVRLLRLRVDQELMVMRAAEALKDAIAGAATQQDLVLIELEAGAARPDVALQVAKAVRDSVVPVIVWCGTPAGSTSGGESRPGGDARVTSKGDGKRSDVTIGAEIMTIGLAATAFAVRPGVDIREADIAPERLLAPDDTDWATVSDDLVELAAAGLIRRGVDDDTARHFARSMVEPDELRWLSVGSEPKRFAVIPKPGEEIRRRPDGKPLVVREQHRQSVFVMAGELAERTGVFDARAMTADEWLKTRGYRVAREQTATIAGMRPGMRDWRMKAATDDLQSVDDLIQSTHEALRLPDPAKRSVSKDTYRAAARKSLEMLNQADRGLEAFEQALTECPEFLRLPPPGHTGVGGKPSVFAERWRSLIQRRKDKLAELRTTANTFAAQ